MRDGEMWSIANCIGRLAIYAAFAACSMFLFLYATGDDLSSSYIGCLLLANGEGSHLYDFHPVFFHIVDTPAWTGAAASAHFTGVLHPYVQTPLWAWLLQPLCAHLTFNAFCAVFFCIAILSLAIMIEIVAHAWARNFLRMLPLAALLLAIVISTPFQYSISLVQTHALFLMLAVLALHLAERSRAGLAGGVLALACAVKITPGLLVVYWLVGGRYRAAMWFVAWSLALVALTVAVAGTDLTLDYVQSMRRVSSVLLVSFNNQSLAAWLAYSNSMISELSTWRILPLTPALKLVSLVASIAGVALSGWMSRSKDLAGASAVLALIAITVFSPIAWTHYFLALIPGAMVLSNAGGWLSAAALITTLLLNAPPLAINPMSSQFGSMTLARSHFYSAVILMIALTLCCIHPKRPKADPGKIKKYAA